MNKAKLLYDNSRSESFKKLNPHLALAGLQNPIAQSKPARPLVEQKKASHGSGAGPRYRVAIISLRKRILDDDNLRGGAKQLRDLIAARLGIDDAEKFVEWEYGQVKSDGEGTIVKIERL